MKYYLRRYWSLLLSFLIGLVILYMLRNDLKTEILLAGIATVISIFISAITFHQHNDRFFKELFTEFNERYNKLNNHLNDIHDDTVLTKEQEQKVIDYLNLCAEEYMWVKKGRIPERIWHSWNIGMKVYMTKKPIGQVFEKERSFWKSSYYGLFDVI